MYKVEDEMGFNKINYDNQYQKDNYDRIIVTVPKGKKNTIIEHYRKKEYESLNQYINALINKDMEPDGGGQN